MRSSHPCINLRVRSELTCKVLGWFPCVQVTSHYALSGFLAFKSPLHQHRHANRTDPFETVSLYVKDRKEDLKKSFELEVGAPRILDLLRTCFVLRSR